MTSLGAGNDVICSCFVYFCVNMNRYRRNYIMYIIKVFVILSQQTHRSKFTCILISLCGEFQLHDNRNCG